MRMKPALPADAMGELHKTHEIHETEQELWLSTKTT